MNNSSPAHPPGLAFRIATMAAGAVLVTSVLLALIGYFKETQTAMRGIDQKLRAVGNTFAALLPWEHHARAQAPGISAAENEAIVLRLTRLADDAGVFYLYTCIQRQDKIHIAMSSASKKEIAEKDLPPAMDAYDQPPPELLDSFRDGQARFASYTDEFGSFRSIFIPIDLEGVRTIIGVDMQLNDLHAIARANLLHFGVYGLVIAVAVGAMAAWVGHRIARPIAGLATDVTAFADDDFSNDQQSLAHMHMIAIKDRTEIGRLALAFIDMRERLVKHVNNLTRVTAEKQEIVSRMATARRIQRSLLPEQTPDTPGFDIYGWSEAAEETGGDFYDWIDLPDGRIVISVADVTGHGIGPAMMAAVCRAYARATMQGQGSLAPLLDKLNRLVHNDTKGEQFVTYFVSVLDPKTRKVHIMSAGHGPILLYHAQSGEVRQTDTHGPPLGVVEDLAADPTTEFTLQPGDVLMVVSDGFFEWGNADGEQFGTERLEQSLLRNSGESATEIVDRLRAEVHAFTAGTTQPDDMTAVIVKCRA